MIKLLTNYLINNINITHAKKKLLTLLLCIESIDLYNQNNYIKYQVTYIKKNLHHVSYQRFDDQYTHNYNKYRILLILSTIHKIITQKSIQNNVIKILKNYTAYSQFDYQNTTILNQYLRRFNYKYTKFHHSNTYKNYNTYQNYIHHIGIINLYLIYKIYSTQNTYYLYKYLKA